MRNKRGGIGLIMFFFVLMTIVILGFVAAMAFGVLDFASDNITPIVTELGMAGNANISEAAEYSVGVVDTFVQALPWLIGLGYVLALIFTLVFVFIVGFNSHPAFIAFYFALMILLVFFCIGMSNMYQDIYTGTDAIATRLQEQTLMSYMLLHSPTILVIITIIGGILIFTRYSTNDGGGVGI